MKDFHNRHAVVRAISPVSVADNTAQVSQIIDTQGFNSLEFAILLGSLADADATFAVTLEHGDQANLSDTVAVPSTQVLGTLATASFDFSADDTTRKIGYGGNKRYVRLTITPANNSAAAVIAVCAILGSAHLNPVA